MIGLLLALSLTTSMHSVTLKWTNNVDCPNRIYRASQAGGPYARLFESTNAITNYVDTDVEARKTYFYVVTSYCPTTTPPESSYSNEVRADIPTKHRFGGRQ